MKRSIVKDALKSISRATKITALATSTYLFSALSMNSSPIQNYQYGATGTAGIEAGSENIAGYAQGLIPIKDKLFVYGQGEAGNDSSFDVGIGHRKNLDNSILGANLTAGMREINDSRETRATLGLEGFFKYLDIYGNLYGANIEKKENEESYYLGADALAVIPIITDAKKYAVNGRLGAYGYNVKDAIDEDIFGVRVGLSSNIRFLGGDLNALLEYYSDKNAGNGGNWQGKVYWGYPADNNKDTRESFKNLEKLYPRYEFPVATSKSETKVATTEKTEKRTTTTTTTTTTQPSHSGDTGNDTNTTH